MRRARYKGTHPKKFSEKYKEHAPHEFKEDIQKIISRGATPAGTHRPICVSEIVEILKPKPGEKILDATLGFGGHASVLIEKILPGGQLIGLDQDPIERKRTEFRLRSTGIPLKSLVVGGINFSDALLFLKENKIKGVNMILADLGVSSMQIDNPERGFSFKIDAPLDLRMNPETGVPGSTFLERLSFHELKTILEENSDESQADKIASSILKNLPQTTLQLADRVRLITKKEDGDVSIRRTFQALRIAVNNEFESLDKFLEDIPKMLVRGGRLAMLTFHSGEDRRVKKSFQNYKRSGVYKEIAETPIRPSFEEQRSNPRSKSAKLRWAVR